MLFYISPFDNPACNIAIEKYFLTSNFPDLCIFYQNRSSVICGRYQNINAEVDHRLLFGTDISFGRRLSGGGTVYQDSGNLNYSFIVAREENVDYYNYFNILIIKALNSIGCYNLNIQSNNIYCEGYKISGTAQFKSRTKILHHGTLLINTELSLLNQILQSNFNYASKAIRSVPARTANISIFLKEKLTSKIISMFISALQYVVNTNKEINTNELNIPFINKYVEIYESDQWIYGNSSYYVYRNYKNQWNYVFLKIKNGIIQDAEIVVSNSNLSNKTPIIGIYHNHKSIACYLDDFFTSINTTYTKNDLMNLFFA